MKPSLDSGNLLQVTSTVAAIAIALATLGIDADLRWWGVKVIPVIFLVAGFIALIGSVSAMIDLCLEQGMDKWSLLGLRWRRATRASSLHTALLCGYWGLMLLGVAYVVMMLENVR